LLHIVLGELSRKDSVSLKYRDVLCKTMEQGSDAEKAYALYLYGKNFGDVSILKSDMSISERMSFALLTIECMESNIVRYVPMNSERRINFDLILKKLYGKDKVNQSQEYTATNKFCRVLDEFTIEDRLQGNYAKADSIKNSRRRGGTNTKKIKHK